MDRFTFFGINCDKKFSRDHLNRGTTIFEAPTQCSCTWCDVQQKLTSRPVNQISASPSRWGDTVVWHPQSSMPTSKMPHRDEFRHKKFPGVVPNAGREMAASVRSPVLIGKLTDSLLEIQAISQSSESTFHRKFSSESRLH